MFDIRYESDRIAENINKAKQIIRLAGILHPIKVRVENIDIILQDETGSELNEKLRSGEEIKISNREIMKLVVKGDLTTGEYVLEQNYPNPFNPSTTIKYYNPELSFISLKIYDVLGNEIVTLVNENKEAGYYTIEWNGSNISSGVYICKLKAGSFVETKKLILLK